MEHVSAAELMPHREPVWRPAADVYRGIQGWLVKLDLAGVRTQDIELSVSGQSLQIRGVRRDWAIREGQQSYSMEIAYNRFERVIELPSDLGQVDVTTEYRDGMLLIHLRTETPTE